MLDKSYSINFLSFSLITHGFWSHAFQSQTTSST